MGFIPRGGGRRARERALQRATPPQAIVAPAQAAAHCRALPPRAAFGRFADTRRNGARAERERAAGGAADSSAVSPAQGTLLYPHGFPGARRANGRIRPTRELREAGRISMRGADTGKESRSPSHSIRWPELLRWPASHPLRQRNTWKPS